MQVRKDGISESEEIRGHTAVGTFITTVTTAGTAVQLANNPCKRAIVTCHQDNSGQVAVGDSNVVAATDGTLRGYNIFQTQSQVFNVTNTNLLFVDAVTNGDSISTYFEN